MWLLLLAILHYALCGSQELIDHGRLNGVIAAAAAAASAADDDDDNHRDNNNYCSSLQPKINSDFLTLTWQSQSQRQRDLSYR